MSGHVQFCQCGVARSSHRGENESRDGCDGFEPQRMWRIVAQHGIGAPDEETARGMIEGVMRHYLGGNTKFADKAWERLSFLFEVVPARVSAAAPGEDGEA